MASGGWLIATSATGGPLDKITPDPPAGPKSAQAVPEARTGPDGDLLLKLSLIEAWWRVLKHGWLFLNSLDSEAKVRGLVEFYVEEHNGRIPHSVFQGQTPDEMCFGSGEHVPGTLAAARADVRRERMAENRARHCAVCP